MRVVLLLPHLAGTEQRHRRSRFRRLWSSSASDKLQGSSHGPAHPRVATQLGRRWARLAWPRAHASATATAPVAARHGGEEGPGRDSRGQGEGGGAGGSRGWTRGSSGRWRRGVASSASRPWWTRPCSARTSMAPRAREHRGRAEGVRASALGFDAHSSRAHGCSREAGARVGMVGRAAAMHSATAAIGRARGVQRSGQGGMPFWASSGPN